MKTGIIGCGNIADIYFSNSIKYFNNFEIVACADIKPEASKHYANIYNVENLTIDQILNNDEIELTINLPIFLFVDSPFTKLSSFNRNNFSLILF